MAEPPVPPDTKSWTWVLQAACPECGFDTRTLRGPDVAALVPGFVARFQAVLARPDVRTRPAPTTWSPLEYACHVRDVHEVFAKRVELMLAEDDPGFANWDQDVTAVEQRYEDQDPATVSVELVERAAEAAAAYAGVLPDQWQRTGRRSNGSVFTVETLGRYHLHDVVHHLWDVTR
jgi:hypothetical protein